MATIGKRNTLTVLRDSISEIYLDGGQHGEILLPNRHVPWGVAMGDRLEVFVYRDSEDRLLATTETPRAAVGEVSTTKELAAEALARTNARSEAVARRVDINTCACRLGDHYTEGHSLPADMTQAIYRYEKAKKGQNVVF